MRAGPLIGYLTTAATMIAAINAIVAAAGVALLAHHMAELAVVPAVLAGIVFAAIFLLLFYRYQRYRTTGLVGDAPPSKSSGS
jgi:ABC-type thiamin/hydroxymethylpyrimidine transport system permease subunit